MLFKAFREDTASFFTKRDPAARQLFLKYLQIIPGLQCNLDSSPESHRFWLWKLKWLARFISTLGALVYAELKSTPAQKLAADSL